MSTLDPRKDRTAIRLLLYENGFTPLPNHNKACFWPGWSRNTVDGDVIVSKEWSRNRRWSDTGIRCGDVVAIDWDVNDPILLNGLLDAVIEAGLLEESQFVRIGMPPRELWVYRTSGKIGKRTTGAFGRADAGPDDKAEQVEILGAGCQFAAFGQRSEDITYTWPAKSLIDSRFMELPEITHDQVDKLRDFCIAFFEEHGLVRKSPLGGTDAGYTHAYDLTPDMVFEVQDLGAMTVGELVGLLANSPNEHLRCSAEPFRPSSGRLDSCMISLANGVLCISDHGTYTSHFPAEGDSEAAIAMLGALLAERFPEAEAAPAAPDIAFDRSEDLTLSPNDRFDVNFVKSLKRYAYMKQDDTIVDLTSNEPGVKLPHWRNLMAQYLMVEPGPRGGTKATHLWEVWLQHKDRKQVTAARMRPDQPWPLYRDGVDLYVNTYRPALLPTNGDARLGIELVERLLPRPEERAWVLQWLSYKVQFPDVRGPAVIMVAHDTFGTGRGTFVELVRAMFALNMVRTIDFATLTGQGTQAQYNDWLADSLFVAINEAQEMTQQVTRWQAKSNAYEQLKSIVEPGGHDIFVKRKTLANYQGRTSATILIMTNHMDSIIMPEGDRRFYVVENGEVSEQEFWHAFNAWLGNKANVGAFTAWLVREVSIVGYNPYAPPPMTRAKADMIEAGSSPLDRAVQAVMKQMHGPLLVKEQVVLALEDWLLGNSVEFPDDWQRTAERIFTRSTRKLMGGVDTVVIEGKNRTARVHGKGPPVPPASPEALRLMLAQNGPVIRPIKTSGTVVAFAAR